MSGWNLPPGCSVSHIPGCGDDDDVDARMRDAAPQLLEACKAALSDLEGCWENGVRKGYQRKQITCLAKLRAAIAAAE